ncbi:MAG: hypothetical protein HKM28_07550 [Flavobacteriaceae bacterium]|nr:hypothetical protein [Flavobacteriaceae bacterium]
MYIFQKIAILFFCSVFLLSCGEDDSTSATTVKFAFNHQWNGEDIDIFNADNIEFETANGELISIERLRYLISDITLTTENGNIVGLEGYHLIDINQSATLNYDSFIEVPTGNYSNVAFRFGFDDTDNIDGAYPDLNVANWSVPGMLGGGYHFMQLEGRFIHESGDELNYQFHTIRAAQNPGPDVETTDTSFTVNLGSTIISANETITINVDLAEWFKNPHIWNLSEKYTTLMPDYDAQITMSQNGPSVFSLNDSLNP